MIKTIKRNNFKKIEAVIANAGSLKFYTLSNSFCPDKAYTDAKEIREILTGIVDRVNSIRLHDNGKVSFEVHSNYWIEVMPKTEV